MTEAQMRELVSATFATAWEAAEPEVPLALEGEPLPSADAFAALTIIPTTSAQLTVGRAGTRRAQRSGWVQIKLWSPAGTGSAALAALGDRARSILELVSMPSPNAGDESLTTQAANVVSIGTDGRWAMSVLRVPFWYAETK